MIVAFPGYLVLNVLCVSALKIFFFVVVNI